MTTLLQTITGWRRHKAAVRGSGSDREGKWGGGGGVALETVIYPNFPLDLTGFFPGKHLIQFLANKMQNVRNSVLHNCILNMILNLMLNKFT